MGMQVDNSTLKNSQQEAFSVGFRTERQTHKKKSLRSDPFPTDVDLFDLSRLLQQLTHLPFALGNRLDQAVFQQDASSEDDLLSVLVTRPDRRVRQQDGLGARNESIGDRSPGVLEGRGGEGGALVEAGLDEGRLGGREEGVGEFIGDERGEEEEGEVVDPFGEWGGRDGLVVAVGWQTHADNG